MEKIFFLIFACFLLLISCSEKPSPDNEFSQTEKALLDVLEITKTSINDYPIILAKDELRKTKGEPTSIKEACGKYIFKHHQGNVDYHCWNYGENHEVVYNILDEQAVLSQINFEKSKLKLVSPKITLSENTSFEEVKRVFPKSSALKNTGAQDPKVRGVYDWIFLKDDLPVENRPNQGLIELRFKDGKLKYFEYYFQREYSRAQMEKYLEQNKKVKNN